MLHNLLFVISHQPNPRFIKQINYLSRYGFNVSVVYFERSCLANLNSNIDKNVKLYSLGAIENGKYLKRIGVYIKSIFVVRKKLKVVQPDKVIITNIDTLFLLILCNIRKYSNDIVMEISDLKSYTFNNKLTDKLQRLFDEIILDKYISKLILTSYKFYEFYYSSKFNGKYFILHNKPLDSMLPKKIEKKKNEKLVIGVVGLLLDGKPHKALFECIKGRSDIEVHIYGKGEYEVQAIEYAENYDNIKYFGEYDFFKDISSIYASLDVIYMSYDTTKNDLNVNLALPNKLYEAMYFKVPIITTKGTYLGEIVRGYGIGQTIECCNFRDINRAITYLNSNNLCVKFDAIPAKEYIANCDYEKLLVFIKESSGGATIN
jgi:succinoglycan biosynthesis protein ExoL